MPQNETSPGSGLQTSMEEVAEAFAERAARRDLEAFIRNCLEYRQYDIDNVFTPAEHRRLLQLVDAKVLRMDGFRFFLREDSHR